MPAARIVRGLPQCITHYPRPLSGFLRDSGELSVGNDFVTQIRPTDDRYLANLTLRTTERIPILGRFCSGLGYNPHQWLLPNVGSKPRADLIEVVKGTESKTAFVRSGCVNNRGGNSSKDRGRPKTWRAIGAIFLCQSRIAGKIWVFRTDFLTPTNLI
jgi:hypothetical protein